MTSLVPYASRGVAKHRGSATAPAFRAGANNSNNGATSIAVTMPASGSGGTVAAGDVALFIVGTPTNTLSSVPSGLTLLGGWSNQDVNTHSDTWPPPTNPAGGDATCWVFSRTLTAGDISTPPTWTFSFGSSTALGVCLSIYKNTAGIGVSLIQDPELTSPLNDGGVAVYMPPMYPGPKDLLVALGVQWSYAGLTGVTLSTATAGWTIRENVNIAPPIQKGGGVWIADGPSAVLQWYGYKPDATNGGFVTTGQSYRCAGILSLTPLDSKGGRKLTDQVSSKVSGVPLYIYSESLFSYVGTSPSTNTYYYYGMANIADRLAWELGASAFKNYSIPGAYASDICGFAYGTVSNYPTRESTTGHNSIVRAATWLSQASLSGLVVVDSTGNDMLNDSAGGTTKAKNRCSCLNATDALVALLRAASMTGPTDASIAYTGSWTNVAQTDVGNGNYKWTSTPGDKVTITVTQDKIDVVLLALDDTNYGQTGATFSVKVDGTLWGSFNTNAPWYTGTGTGTVSNQTRKSSGAAGLFSYKQSPYCCMRLPIYGMGAGSHTIVITHTGSSGQYLPFNAYLIPSATPPYVQLGKLPRYNFASVGIGTIAAEDAYNSMMDVIASWFTDGKVIVFDPNEATTVATLSSQLSTGGAATSLPITGCVSGVPNSTVVTVVDPNSRNAQTWTLTSALLPAASSISVSSQTPDFAYPAGSLVIMPTSEFNAATMINTVDYVHPNDVGTGFWAHAIIRNLQAKIG